MGKMRESGCRKYLQGKELQNLENFLPALKMRAGFAIERPRGERIGLERRSFRLPISTIGSLKS
jgi:hypothetical protein